MDNVLSAVERFIIHWFVALALGAAILEIILYRWSVRKGKNND